MKEVIVGIYKCRNCNKDRTVILGEYRDLDLSEVASKVIHMEHLKIVTHEKCKILNGKTLSIGFMDIQSIGVKEIPIKQYEECMKENPDG